MLQIIWFILKIIGGIFFAIITILLLIILAILFASIKYRVKIIHQDNIYLKGKIKWLFSILYIPILYEKDKLSIKVKIFGIIIFNNEKVKKPKKSKETKKKNKVIKSNTKNKRKNIKESIDSNKANNYVTKKVIEDNNKNKEQTIKSQQEIYNKKTIKDKVKDKINLLIQKLKDFLEKVRKIISDVKRIKNFINNPTNKSGINKVKETFVKFLKHIKPKKIKSFTKFGFDTPSTTGQVLGIISAFGIGLGKDIKIIPDFTDEVFEGEHYAKGRIRIIKLLIIISTLLLNKDFQKFKNNVINFKEEE